ncbi:ankyrin repeat domain-containing protein [Legionella lytica]|uniref:Ankyrin repeat domain-containing protein n=1 Tax=Legionella lytica TaxID=96232 RepID=A0ABY4Y8B2_9GAMM|nr:ankyrin repeat domain-containing protein [Legionella lytica]USQ13741.1 ankyrin repeat domain-containing protein [Legionella lytica]
MSKYLRQYIPKNKSGGLITLSISESLLLAIEAGINANIGQAQLEILYKLYLEGRKTPEQTLFLSELQTILKDKGYLVSTSPQTTNEDPTRRYFETHLAYHLLENNAETLVHDELITFTENLRKRLYSLPTSNANRIKVEAIFSGDIDSVILSKYEQEYAELILKLAQHDYHGLSRKACDNCLQIACATSLATLNTQLDAMPADIYEDSEFTMGMEGRGRITKSRTQQEWVRTTAKGLMKSTTPLPLYGDRANAINKNYEERNNFSPFQRSVDQSKFMTENQSVQHLFSYQIHAYSNGISSTTLAQIRNMILEKRLEQPYFQGVFQKYMTVFAALMVYNSGGHSFFEIFEVFKLPICRELIENESFILNCIARDQLMYQWLYVAQKEAFDTSLQATIAYMHVLLAKKQMHAELYPQNVAQQILASSMSLHKAIIHANPEEFSQAVARTPKTKIDTVNHYGWTVLMIAAQLGKTTQVRTLLNAGANIHKEVKMPLNAKIDAKKQINGLSALEMAIKWQHYETTEALLKAGALVKRSQTEGDTLKQHAPALYFSCRQPDMRILNLILEADGALDLMDMKEALFCTLDVENLPAVQVLVKHIDKQCLASALFTEECKFELLKKTVILGNTQLIQGLISLNLYPATMPSAPQQLLNTAVEKGFVPVVKLLLSLFANTNSTTNLHEALLIALKNRRFNVAEFLLLSDADTHSISSDAPHVNGFIAYLKTSKPKQLVLIEGHSGNFSIQRKPSDVRYGGLFFGDKLHSEPSSSTNSDFSLVS